MTTPTELREKATRYRNMALHLSNRTIAEAINQLADEYEKKAAEMEEDDARSDDV